MDKRKRKELCVKEKIDFINVSDGKSQRQLADLFGIGKTQVQAILKRKAQFLFDEMLSRQQLTLLLSKHQGS